MLKLSSKALTDVLTTLFNNSLRTATFPICIKSRACDARRQKELQVQYEQLYTLISVLPVVSQLFEKLLCVQLRGYFEDILCPQQHGFRQARSYQIALISLTNLLFSNRNSGSFATVASLDLRKAFECLNYEVLLSRLRANGLSDSCVACMV